MGSFKYPQNLAEIAKRNLAQADASVSKFNDVANRVSRLPYKASPAVTTDVPQAGSAFKFSSIGGPVDTSIGGPLPTSPQPSGTADSTNWRFRSFGQSQLPNGNANGADWRFTGFKSNLDKPVASSMDAPYKTSPDAYNRIASSPVVPQGYQPMDTTEHEKQYGYGSAYKEED